MEQMLDVAFCRHVGHSLAKLLNNTPWNVKVHTLRFLIRFLTASMKQLVVVNLVKCVKKIYVNNLMACFKNVSVLSAMQ